MSALPKMAGVFEVEVDGVEHDHGHDDEPVQVTTAPRFYSPVFSERDAERVSSSSRNGAKC